jgi:hypothetical protein
MRQHFSHRRRISESTGPATSAACASGISPVTFFSALLNVALHMPVQSGLGQLEAGRDPPQRPARHDRVGNIADLGVVADGARPRHRFKPAASKPARGASPPWETAPASMQSLQERYENA